jgi:hypothetical protein
MDENTQALFMQARICHLASQRWDTSLKDAVSTLLESGALAFIGDCFDYFHLQGDDAVLDDVEDYLASQGVVVHANA